MKYLLLLLSLFLVIAFLSCKKETNKPLPAEPLKKRWILEFTTQQFSPELQGNCYLHGLYSIDFKNDSCFFVGDHYYKLISDTTQKWSEHFDITASTLNIGRFIKTYNPQPAVNDDLIGFMPEYAIMDSSRVDELRIWPAYKWQQLSGIPGQLAGGSFYTVGSSIDNSSTYHHRKYDFSDSLYAYFEDNHSLEFPATWSEKIVSTIEYKQDSYNEMYGDPVYYCFDDGNLITSYNEFHSRVLATVYIKK